MTGVAFGVGDSSGVGADVCAVCIVVDFVELDATNGFEDCGEEVMRIEASDVLCDGCLK